MADWFVCVMGIGTVFAGLIALVFICYIMSFVCKLFAKPESAKTQTQPSHKQNSLASSARTEKIANKGEIIAAACAAIAEELGEDVKNIKVVSFKKA